jgi:hypothetical protein
MLARRLLQSSCYGQARPLQGRCARLRGFGEWPSTRPAVRISTRVFASYPRYSKDEARARTLQQEVASREPKAETITPESEAKKKGADPRRQDTLLAEQTTSNQAQRKADWAILKEMSKYLWPKDDWGARMRVGLSVGLLIGAKVSDISLSPFPHVSMLIPAILGAQCTNPILLQKHRRLHEH